MCFILNNYFVCKFIHLICCINLLLIPSSAFFFHFTYFIFLSLKIPLGADLISPISLCCAHVFLYPFEYTECVHNSWSLSAGCIISVISVCFRWWILSWCWVVFSCFFVWFMLFGWVLDFVNFTLLVVRSWGTFKNNIGFGSSVQLNYRGQVGPFKACSFSMGFPGGTSSKEPACQCRRHKRRGFDPWVKKIPWRRKWQPTPVFLPGESRGERSLVGYGPWGRTELDTTEATEHTVQIVSSLSPCAHLAPLLRCNPFEDSAKCPCVMNSLPLGWWGLWKFWEFLDQLLSGLLSCLHEFSS